MVTYNVNPNSARSSLHHPGSSQMSMSASPLDDLLLPGLAIDLLKIDVEGGDYLVLEGAKRIFQHSPPRVVVVEVSDAAKEIRDFLLARGYRLYQFDAARSSLVEVGWPVFDTYAVLDAARPELTGFTFTGRASGKPF